MLAEGSDFVALQPDYRVVELANMEGPQERCSFFEILDDKDTEGDEYFTVKLSSSNPQVVLETSEAIVTIHDDEDGEVTTTNSPTPTTPMPTDDPTTG